MFLEKIVESTQKRMAQVKREFDYPFEQALRKPGISFICEVKKASPSKGIIAENFPYEQIAVEYEQAGAAAISVLTEPEYFLGSEKYLGEISKMVKIPTLRKDFIIDEYQIYKAKTLGASAVLLISEILDKTTLSNFISLTHSLGMSALVESHSREMLEKSLECGAKIVGVNNRNLETFEVDINNSINLRKYVPNDVLYVAESGISTADDIKRLSDAGANGVLIGETLMKSHDKNAALKELRSLI